MLIQTLTERLDAAFRFARTIHATQVRKSTGIPYLAHLMAVGALVLENGADESTAIAALLHDAAEDQGGDRVIQEIREQFGNDVAGIVLECSETFEVPKPPWRERKERYLDRIPSISSAARLVILADKLHNGRAIVDDLRSKGTTTWSKFNGGKEGTLWYYTTVISQMIAAGEQCQLLDELKRTVAIMHELAN